MMSMMNKCAKFNVDIPSGYKLKLILASEIELSWTTSFCKGATLISQTFSPALHSTAAEFLFFQQLSSTRRFDAETRAFFGYTPKLSKSKTYLCLYFLYGCYV